MSNKFRAKRTVFDGIQFHSRREGLEYLRLKALQDAGEIENLELQPKFKFEMNGVRITTYTADFQYNKVGCPYKVVVDVKSPPTRKKHDYRIKKKMMKAFFGIEIMEVL